MRESNESSPFYMLPTEIFLQICSLLQVRDLVLSLSFVCKRFNEILSDENFWRSLIAKRWNYKYPFQSIDNENFDWKRASFEMEKQWNLWKSREETVRRMNVLPNVHIAAVDAVVFINNSICVSASRDRSLVIWNPIKSTSKFPSYVQKDSAHNGWIWRLLYSQNLLYSCSWDNTVKIWAFDSSDFHLKSTFRCSSPVLSLSLLDSAVVAGDYGKFISGFDPRCGSDPVFKYTAHKKAVLTLGALGSDLISGSEDRTLVIWDSRAQNIKQRILVGKERFPNCSCMEENILYVGDNKGSVHVYSTTGNTLKRLKLYNIGHQKPISVIKNGTSYLLTGSHDGTVKISLPIQPLKVLTSIKTTRGEVGGVICGLSGLQDAKCSFVRKPPDLACPRSRLIPFGHPLSESEAWPRDELPPFGAHFSHVPKGLMRPDGEMDYRNGILAVGTSNYLEFWVPKEYVSDSEIDSSNMFENGFRTQFD